MVSFPWSASPKLSNATESPSESITFSTAALKSGRESSENGISSCAIQSSSVAYTPAGCVIGLPPLFSLYHSFLRKHFFSSSFGDETVSCSRVTPLLFNNDPRCASRGNGPSKNDDLAASYVVAGRGLVKKVLRSIKNILGPMKPLLRRLQVGITAHLPLKMSGKFPGGSPRQAGGAPHQILRCTQSLP